jgi:hypothetical protein
VLGVLNVMLTLTRLIINLHWLKEEAMKKMEVKVFDLLGRLEVINKMTQSTYSVKIPAGSYITLSIKEKTKTVRLIKNNEF